MPSIELHRLDQVLAAADSALRTLAGADSAGRVSPAVGVASPPLSESERRLSGRLMRVNHVGEICAQALYTAQALSTRDAALRAHFLEAAREESDHLAWTRERIAELNTHASVLNPIWYAGAFALGLIAGRNGDPLSLGFVVETERQVEQHLNSHLDRLPAGDAPSRAIVEKMKEDEVRHGAAAQSRGAARLPAPVRMGMRLASRVMTATAHYL